MNFISKFLLAFTLTFTFSSQATETTNGTRYWPFVSCNNGTFLFFIGYQEGKPYESTQGLLSIASPESAPLVTHSMYSVSYSQANTEGIKGHVVGIGKIEISAEGNSSFARPVCKIDGGIPRCQLEKVDLKCNYLPPTPSGFSGGN